MPRIIVVAQEGPADRRSIGEAISLADTLPPGPVEIRVGPGTYREKLRLFRPDTALIGSGARETRIEWGDGALTPLHGGGPMGTFNSYVAYLGAPGARLEGLTLRNDAGDGRVVGQAVALYADADRLLVRDCALLGRQDTLCTGPLPKDPLPKGIELAHRVAGLGEDEPVLPFRQAYEDCLIEGDVDFIFGSAAALFRRCEIRSLGRGADDVYVAAPSTYPGQVAGFVFLECRLTYSPDGEHGPRGRAFLGRPWRSNAKAVYARCELGAHVDPAGWDDWGKSEARELSYFGELGSTGPGARPGDRVPWARRPGEAELMLMLREAAF